MDIVKIQKVDINRMVNECVRELLNEDQTAKSISAAIKLIMDVANVSHEKADEFVRKTVRMESPVLRSKQGGKFILGVTRMHLEGLRPSKINQLNNVLSVIVSCGLVDKFDRNLNGLSLGQLLWELKDEIKKKAETEKSNLGSFTGSSESNYRIVKIDRYEDAHKYSEYTTWCITQSEAAFDSYTQFGTNQFYFCLRNGFENVEATPTQDAPLDEYGLSMLAVSVDDNGWLATCTCRWNHDNGGNDNVLDTYKISELIGRNFYSVFKPNNNWSDRLSLAMRELEHGVPPEEVFDSVYNDRNDAGISRVNLSMTYNYLTPQNRILCDDWFEYAGAFSEGYGLVTTKYGDNLVDVNGEYLFDKWYENLGAMSEGRVKVMGNGKKWNYMRKDGSVISQEWFDEADNFEEGCARVFKFDLGYNLLDHEGNILCDKWYKKISYPSCGLRLLFNEGRLFNFLDNHGKLRFKTWFKRATSFCEDTGQAYVTLNKVDDSGEYPSCYIDTEGNIEEQPYSKLKGKIE
jgi:hypothetical protein